MNNNDNVNDPHLTHNSLPKFPTDIFQMTYLNACFVCMQNYYLLVETCRNTDTSTQ